MMTTSTVSGVIDLDSAETAAAELMRALGMDPCEPSLVATPRRVAKAYADLLTPAEFAMTTFPNDEIAAWLDEHLEPRGTGVVLRAEHSCMTQRGVQAQGSTTTTSAHTGLIRTDQRTRSEFLALAIGNPPG